jgi:hypothetical protein
MRVVMGVFAFAGAILCSSAFAQVPELATLEPAAATTRTVVTINGTNLTKGSVVWDAGQASERLLVSDLGGAHMFSVPPDASVGHHWVAVQNENGRSTKIKFEVVNAAPPNSNPRIDDISLIDTNFVAGKVKTVLYVQGANIDVNAKVLVNGTLQSSDAHKVLINNLFGADPAILGYPIRHYLSRIVPLPPHPIGSEIRVQIENEKGELSNTRHYKLPQDMASLDSDGDGIPDLVEASGVYDNGAGGGTVDIRALGADPFRKDVLVEVDVMENLAHPPSDEVFDRARGMFSAAPILNPFGPNGINLVVNATGKVENWLLLSMEAKAHQWGSGTGSFALLKAKYFTLAHRGLFHYAIWAKEHIEGRSGQSNADLDHNGFGDGFFVSLDDFDPPYQTVTSRAATFVHELGHDLGQRHGGTTNDQYTPTYWSVMSYAWQLRTGLPDKKRRERATCTQIYYATPGALEVNGALPQGLGTGHRLGTRLDYSEGMGPTVVANDHSLNEDVGVCGQPIDWNGNGHATERGVNSRWLWCDFQNSDCHPRASDYPNWANLSFRGPKEGGLPPSGGPMLPTSVATGRVQLAQLEGQAGGLKARLAQQNLIEKRIPTISAQDALVQTEDGQKLQRVKDLVVTLEKSRNVPPGTVSVENVTGTSVVLKHDVQKLRDAAQNKLRVPFSVAIPPALDRPTTETAGQLEYHVERHQEFAREVVGLKVGSEVAARALRSGNEPASLRIDIADLAARQIDGPGPELPVEVKVAGERRELRAGEVARMGGLDVRIVVSVKLSSRPDREGPPYVLRLLVNSAL